MKMMRTLTKEATPLMYEIYHRPIKELEDLDYESLKKLYQPESGDVKLIYELFKVLEEDCPSDSRKIKGSTGFYEEMICVFSRMCYLFHRSYCIDSLNNKNAIHFFEACQVGLSRLQNKYNQLVYRRQIKVAYWALGVTLFFSIVSILLTLYGDCLPMKAYVYVP